MESNLPAAHLKIQQQVSRQATSCSEYVGKPSRDQQTTQGQSGLDPDCPSATERDACKEARLPITIQMYLSLLQRLQIPV
jgi:hypothetical protein